MLIFIILSFSLIVWGVPIESCSRSICTTLTDCDPYMQLLHSTPRSQKRPLFVYLRSQECGINFDRRMPMVCCYNSAQNIRKKYMNYNDNNALDTNENNDRVDSTIDWRKYEKTREDNVLGNAVAEELSYFFEEEFDDEQMNPIVTTKFKYSDKAYDLTRRRRGTIGFDSAMVDVEIR